MCPCIPFNKRPFKYGKYDYVEKKMKAKQWTMDFNHFLFVLLSWFFFLLLAILCFQLPPFLFFILSLLFLTVPHSAVSRESLVSVIVPVVYCTFEYPFTSATLLHYSISPPSPDFYHIHAAVPVSVLLFPENPAALQWIISTLFLFQKLIVEQVGHNYQWW